MAMQTANSTAIPSAQVVGNAFVEQYYHILHASPESVHRFYHDSSLLSRPDTNGIMTTVATMKGINEKILSLNFKDYTAEIKTADAQKSYMDGVTVLVTGSLMGKDNIKRKFAQSFFLAPQDNGYFVLNDVFRFVEDNEPLENNSVYDIDNTPTVPVIRDSEPSHVIGPSAPDPTILVVEQDKVAENANEPVDSGELLIYKEEVVLESQSHSNGNDVSIVIESGSQEDIPKKSYASIVKVEKGISGPTKVYVPTNTSKMTHKKLQDQPVLVAPVTEHETSMPSTNERSNAQEEVEGYSIYIRNLPYNMRPSQLEAEFNKYGPIKQGGVQVRYHKQQGYCFGFVEFETPSSMNSAIQASPVSIGGRQAVIEMKRTSTRVGMPVAAGSGRGRFSSGRSGFQNENFRNRGSYLGGGGRGSGRNEYGNRSEFGGQGRSGGRSEGYQQSRGRGRGRA